MSHLQKFSDDSSIIGCIADDREEEYRDLIESFIGWCDIHHLQLSTGKTKELVVDFRRSKRPHTPVVIRGEGVEMVDTYQFLGVHLNNKLDWTDNTEALYRKGQSRLFFLRRLRSFNVCTRLLRMFYQSVVASVIFFAGVCWGGGIGTCGANKLGKLVKKASSVVGMELDGVEVVGPNFAYYLKTLNIETDTHIFNWRKKNKTPAVSEKQQGSRFIRSVPPHEIHTV
ncbi:uncharacterized protein LOC128624412 [Ictalurus furcatus]|uniref:uncharacterized protein LOC128624412 n=1 Tax=Ictalurus furcatus TaxID=66913 RepID=UPI00234FFB2D|nr:uncharacterized protein LOC128624412 [Ictalurus furcatus]